MIIIIIIIKYISYICNQLMDGSTFVSSIFLSLFFCFLSIKRVKIVAKTEIQSLVTA